MEREIAVVIWLALSVVIVLAIDNAARHEREQREKHANWQLINDVLAHDRAKREGERTSVRNLGKPSKGNTVGFVPKVTYDKLEAENAKLRELASDMLSAMRHTESGVGTNCVVCYSRFAQKLYELGIEVANDD